MCESVQYVLQRTKGDDGNRCGNRREGRQVRRRKLTAKQDTVTEGHRRDRGEQTGQKQGPGFYRGTCERDEG